MCQNMPGRLQTKSKNVWKILFCILTFESLPPAPIFHPHPYYAILTHGITKGWLCIDGGSGILSIWLNQQKIIKHKGWRRKKSEPSILPFYLLPLLPAHATSSHCKQGENIWWRHWYKIDAGGGERGRAGRFVSNRFGQNVSPISRFASVWLPLAKLGGSSVTPWICWAQGSVGWEFEFEHQQHQSRLQLQYLCTRTLATKKWKVKFTRTAKSSSI